MLAEQKHTRFRNHLTAPESHTQWLHTLQLEANGRENIIHAWRAAAHTISPSTDSVAACRPIYHLTLKLLFVYLTMMHNCSYKQLTGLPHHKPHTPDTI